ncbi:hypothetical protein BBD42_19590 [Paenibacillus sp. BIHB 4019]|uniref:Uncharacterized protein n=1 Tax=Paenibacillus sp. BIHB 4019 TaxID=1870819 RepID=A0A1B2DL28_9BACL|nr:hypothetical protein BBD42_19590 [Paenibacillus sp. BIHB 4019]
MDEKIISFPIFQGETAIAVLWRRSAFHSEKYREWMSKSYPFLYFKVKRLSPSFGGAARFIPRNIENG